MEKVFTILIYVIVVIYYLSIMPIGFIFQNLLIIATSIKHVIVNKRDFLDEITENYADSFESNAKFIRYIMEEMKEESE